MFRNQWSSPCLLLAFLGCFSCLFPILSRNNDFYTSALPNSYSPLRDSISSDQYQKSLQIQLAIGMPILSELFLEFVGIISLKHSDNNAFNLLTRFFLMFGMISPSLLMAEHRSITNFMCSESLRRTSIVGFSVTMLSVHSCLAKVVTPNFEFQGFTALLFYIFAELFWLLNYFFFNQYKSLSILSSVFVLGGYLLLLNLSFKFYGISWIVRLLSCFVPSSYLGQLLSLNNKVVPNEVLEIVHIPSDESVNTIINASYMNICVIGLFVIPISIVIMGLACGNVYLDINKASITELCVYTYLQVILMAFLIVVPHWKLKR